MDTQGVRAAVPLISQIKVKPMTSLSGARR